MTSRAKRTSMPYAHDSRWQSASLGSVSTFRQPLPNSSFSPGHISIFSERISSRALWKSSDSLIGSLEKSNCSTFLFSRISRYQRFPWIPSTWNTVYGFFENRRQRENQVNQIVETGGTCGYRLTFSEASTPFFCAFWTACGPHFALPPPPWLSPNQDS